MKILILSRAQKTIERLPGKTKIKIFSAIDRLEKFPDVFPKSIKKLTAQPGYRLRVGDYRILFIVDQKKNALYIVRFAHRKDIYRW